MRRRRGSDAASGSIGGDSWAGYSDLMAGLLLIFIFVTVLKDVQLRERVAEPSNFLRAWRDAIQALCKDPELLAHGLAPDCDTGTIELPDQVFFDFNRTDLKEDGRERLRAALPIILEKLREQPLIWDRLEVEVRGHADPRVETELDPYEVNLEKSEKRAETVLLFLTSDSGIPDRDRTDFRDLAVASGAADSKPPEGCEKKDTPECHDRMRRVEIHLRFDDLELRKDFFQLLDQILSSSVRMEGHERLG